MELRRYTRHSTQAASAAGSGHVFSKACAHLRHLDLRSALDRLFGLRQKKQNEVIQSEAEVIMSRIKAARKSAADNSSDYTLTTYTWHP